jgi:hypothetical protein
MEFVEEDRSQSLVRLVSSALFLLRIVSGEKQFEYMED